MHEVHYLTDHEVRKAAGAIAAEIATMNRQWLMLCYAIPRGGIPAAYLVQHFTALELVDDPKDAEFFIDDLIDSGETMRHYTGKYERPLFALFDKAHSSMKNKWLVFPWEGTIEHSASDIITRQLEFIGEDPSREGLLETPRRVVRAWNEWFSGYKQDPSDVFKTFKDGGEQYDQMVIVKDVPFYSHCEHHIAPFFGTATLAYIPDKRIVGLSKLSRLVTVFARRLQVQERLTTQINETMIKELKPKGCGVIIKARHLCMESRGISKQGHRTITSAVFGALRDKPEARAEFMRLAE